MASSGFLVVSGLLLSHCPLEVGSRSKVHCGHWRFTQRTWEQNLCGIRSLKPAFPTPAGPNTFNLPTMRHLHPKESQERAWARRSCLLPPAHISIPYALQRLKNELCVHFIIKDPGLFKPSFINSDERSCNGQRSAFGIEQIVVLWFPCVGGAVNLQAFNASVLFQPCYQQGGEGEISDIS